MEVATEVCNITDNSLSQLSAVTKCFTDSILTCHTTTAGSHMTEVAGVRKQ
jgi:hypothetical protein